MRVSNVNLRKYIPSFSPTQKVIRTITPQKQFIQKSVKQDSERERKLREYFQKQKAAEKEIAERLNNSLLELQAEHMSYIALLFYGIKVDKTKILEKLKARKAK